VSRVTAAVVLTLRFLAQVVASGLATAWLIVAGPRALHPGLVSYIYAPMSERGALLLAALVTLTPGTTVIEIDPRQRQMLLHVLDGAGADAALSDIHRELERYVAVLFPAEA
jgi:multisubunit Na+/H+ antiporter MnhE subunit